MILTDQNDRRLIHAALVHYEKTKAYKGKFERIHVGSMKALWRRHLKAVSR